MRWQERAIFGWGEFFSPGFTRNVTGTRPAPSASERDRKLRELFSYVWSHNPFYKKKYRLAGLTPSSIRGYSDAAKIPCLTKAEAAGGGLRNRRKKIFVTLASGGTSSRQKVVTYLDKSYLMKRYQMLLSILYGRGWRLGDAIVALHPLEYAYFHHFFGMARTGQIRKLIFDFFQQYILYRLFHNRRNLYYGGDVFTEDRAGYFFPRIFGNKPRLLLGRPDVINVLVKQAEVSGSPLFGVENVITVGNILTEKMRRRLSDAFGGGVDNLYASTELGYVALSCPYSGGAMHIDEDNYLLEIDSGGEIILTDFNNTMMPLVRYRTSDIGEVIEKKCACGLSGKMLRIIGRRDRYLSGRGGRKIYESDVIDFFEGHPEIWSYQFMRGSDGGIRFIFSPKETSKAKIDATLEQFAQQFDVSRDDLRDDREASLVTTTSGKFCCII